MHNHRWLLRIAFACLALIGFSGCVRRRLTVRTNPAGAAVYVDKQYIGSSPAATSFVYYGTREIEVVRDGYRTEKMLRKISPPWYQLPPLDFFSETLWPSELRDKHVVDITMLPAENLSSQELDARANNLRSQALQGIATPLPPPVAGQNFNGSGGFPTLPPGATYSTQPIDPTYPVPVGPIVSTQPPTSHGHSFFWHPGRLLGKFFQPNGTPPTSIPEVGILPGGGYRPPID